MGYAETQKGFSLYEPVSRKVKISRYVIFHEHEQDLSSSTTRSTDFSDFDCVYDGLAPSGGDGVSANEPTHLERFTGTTSPIPCFDQLPSTLLVAHPNSSTHVNPEQPIDNNPPPGETMENSHHHDEIDPDSDPFYGFTPVRRSQRIAIKRNVSLRIPTSSATTTLVRSWKSKNRSHMLKPWKVPNRMNGNKPWPRKLSRSQNMEPGYSKIFHQEGGQ